MIIDISDSTFKDILNDEKLFLPIRWDGSDFSSALGELFNYYIKKFETLIPDSTNDFHRVKANIKDIKRTCGLINKAVDHYLNGFPSKAYSSFERAMILLMDTPLKIYQKSIIEQFKTPSTR